MTNAKRNSRTTRNIARKFSSASGRIFIALTNGASPTNEHEPATEHMAQRERSATSNGTTEDYRTQMASALKNWNYYPDAMRYHVTDSPTFNARHSLTASTSDDYAFKYAEYKLNAMFSNGDFPNGELPVLYIWDLAAPSGTLMPIAKLTFIDGEVKRT